MNAYPELAELLLKVEQIVRVERIICIRIYAHDIEVHLRDREIYKAPGEARIDTEEHKNYDKIIKEHGGITYFALREKIHEP